MNSFHFTVSPPLVSLFTQSQKTTAEPANSNDKSVANNCTPLNRAFFIRSTTTPKENAQRVFLPMVAYHGKGSALCCVPLIAVLQPVIRYRQNQSLQTLRAVTPKNFSGAIAMIYLFLGVQRQHLSNTNLNLRSFPKTRLAIRADSEQQARAQLAKNWLLLQSWAFKNPAEIHRTFAKGVIYA